MITCCVHGCKSNSSSKNSGISFHRLPKNTEFRNKWIENICQPDWVPGPKASICSLHFEENAINRTMQLSRIKDNCFPTIFPNRIVPSDNVQILKFTGSHEDKSGQNRIVASDNVQILKSTGSPEDKSGQNRIVASDNGQILQSTGSPEDKCGQKRVVVANNIQILKSTGSTQNKSGQFTVYQGHKPRIEIRPKLPMLPSAREQKLELRMTTYQKKIKRLKETVSRQAKRIEKLQSIITDLKENNSNK